MGLESLNCLLEHRRETPLRAASCVDPCMGRPLDPRLSLSPRQDSPSSLLPEVLEAGSWWDVSVVAELSLVPGQRLVELWLGFPRWLLWFGVGAPLQGDMVLQETFCGRQHLQYLWRYRVPLWLLHAQPRAGEAGQLSSSPRGVLAAGARTETFRTGITHWIYYPVRIKSPHLQSWRPWRALVGVVVQWGCG